MRKQRCWEIEHRSKNLNEKKRKFLQVSTSHIRFIFSEYIPYYITFLSKLSFLHTTYIFPVIGFTVSFDSIFLRRISIYFEVDTMEM